MCLLLVLTDAKHRNIWDDTGTSSPVAFVNPAFLESQESMDRGPSDSFTRILTRGTSVKLGLETNPTIDDDEEWRTVVNKTLEGFSGNNRMNNALAIPR